MFGLIEKWVYVIYQDRPTFCLSKILKMFILDCNSDIFNI